MLSHAESVLLRVSAATTSFRTSACQPCCSPRHSAVFCASSRHFLLPRCEIQGVFARICSVRRRSDNGVMTSTTRVQHRYDHRLRELVRSTGDVECAIRRGVPRSTARGWLTSNRTEVITLDVADMDALRLQQEVLELRDRVQRLVALLRIMAVLLKVSGFSLAGSRLPDGTAKITLLRAIERSRSVLSLRIVLRLLRLSQSRYHSWKREQECGLDDVPSCPRTSPQQLTSAEVETVKQMVTSDAATCQQERWLSLHSVLARSSPRQPPGTGSCDVINGDGLVDAFIRPVRKLAFELPVPTRSGMSTRH